MIHLKNPQEIAIMAEGGKILRAVVNKLMPQIQAGMSTNQVDQLAESLIRDKGAEPSFTKVPGYRWTTCLPVNEQVVHTPPSKRVLINGDVLTVDIGVFHKGFHTDYATTIVIGQPKDAEVTHFLESGKRALNAAIKKATVGRHLGEISHEIQTSIEGEGYRILRELTGHGIGHELHEDPFVLGYEDRPASKTYKMPPGLVIAIEVIYSVSTPNIAYESGNKWSITSSDRSLTACFEKTVALQDKNTFILT